MPNAPASRRLLKVTSYCSLAATVSAVAAGVSEPGLRAGATTNPSDPLVQSSLIAVPPSQIHVAQEGNGFDTISFEGRTVSVPQSEGTALASNLAVEQSSTSLATPDNTRTGSCGSSWLYLRPTGTAAAIDYTGYSVTRTKIGTPQSAQWVTRGVNTSNATPFSTYFGANNPPSFWTDTYKEAKGAGHYFAYVTTYTSFVIGTKDICVPPDDVTSTTTVP